MRKIFIAVFFIFIAGVLAFNVYASKVEDDFKKGLVRLHVIANSDDPFDQQIKYKVRDEIIEKSKGMQETPSSGDLDFFKEAAEDVLDQYGIDYGAEVSFGTSWFPTKKYKDLTFPAGNYTALCVILGDGQGKNWWCVLYPPLCFVGADGGYLDEGSKEILKENLTREEYNLITQGDKKLPYEIKFKSLEMLGKMKKFFIK